MHQHRSLQLPVSIWLVCVSADIHCPSAYVSNSLMTTDKAVALGIYKLHLLPYNQRYLLECSLRQITFKIKKNGIDFSVILISCRTQQAFDWTLNTLMLYFCLLQIRNGVCTRHKAKAICKNNEVKLREKENYPLYFQAKGLCFCKAVVRGHTAAWLKSHTLFISVPPFSSKLDFNFNAWYKKPLLGLCFCLLSSHRRLSLG